MFNAETAMQLEIPEGTVDEIKNNLNERIWQRSAKIVGRAVGSLTFAGNRNLPIPSVKFYGASAQEMGSAAVYEISGYTHKVTQLIAAYWTPTDRGLTTQLDTTTGVSTINGTSTDTFANVSENIPATAKSHKVYIQMQIVKNANSVPLQFGALNQGLYTPVSDTGTLGAVGTIDPARALTTGIRNFPAGSVFNDVRVVLQIFDLTEDFGAGKEPSSVSACQDYYGDVYYSKGTHLVSAKSPISIGSTQLTFTGELTKWDKIRSDGRRTTKGATLVLGSLSAIWIMAPYEKLLVAHVKLPGCKALYYHTSPLRNWESTYPDGRENIYNDEYNIGKIVLPDHYTAGIGFPKGTTKAQAAAAMAGQVIAYELKTETVTAFSPFSYAVGQPVTDARGVPLTATEKVIIAPSPELPSDIKINNSKWTLNGGTVDLSLINGGGLFGDGGLADYVDTATGIGRRAFGKVVLSDISDWSVYSGCYISSYISSSVKSMLDQSEPSPGKCTHLPVVSAMDAYDGTIGIAIDSEKDIVVNVGTTTRTVPQLQELLHGAVLYYPLEEESAFATYAQTIYEKHGDNDFVQSGGDIESTESDITYYAYIWG